jgi:hypothetical protein
MWTDLVSVALANHAVALTAATSPLFHPLRDRLARRSRLLGTLAACPYCISHWTGFLLVWLCRISLLPGRPWPLDYAVSSFAVIGVSVLLTAGWIHLSGYRP